MRRKRSTWIVAIAFAAIQGLGIEAHASSVASSSNSSAQTFGISNWAVNAVNPATSNSAGQYTISAIAKSPNWSYFWVKNIGNVQTISFNTSNTTSGASGSTVTTEYCPAINNPTQGTCSGSWASFNTQTGSQSNNQKSLTFTLSPGDALQFRMQYKTGTAVISSSFSVTVTRSDVRAATTTNG